MSQAAVPLSLLAPAPATVPSLEDLLVAGGDARITPDASGRNRYGCPTRPAPDVAAFASSTASIISATSFEAARRLHERLSATHEGEQARFYEGVLGRMRRELLRACDASDALGTEVVFAASGTDLHLIAAQLAAGGEKQRALAVVVDPTETGSVVPDALRARHVSSRAALAATVAEGTELPGASLVDLATVPLRRADGSPRDAEEIDADVTALVTAGAASGQRVLLVLVDVSKTGLIAPSPACALALKRRLPDSVDVLVDACQLRLASRTLRAYLDHGFMVALTGSKFLTGPSFSGALVIPQLAARRLRTRPLASALGAYSARADWPRSFRGPSALPDVANFGLLLRWEAALAELRAFRAVPETEVARFLSSFARMVRGELGGDLAFEPLPAPSLERRLITDRATWDHLPTIFPFLLQRPGAHGWSAYLTRDETTRVHRELIGMGIHLGQPVACGKRRGTPVSALRLCASSRLVVAATANGPEGAEAVLSQARHALRKAAELARRT